MSDAPGKKELKTGGWSARYVLIICSLLYMVNYMDRQVLSAVLQPMKVDLGLSDTQAGMLQTVFLLSIALFSLPVAYMVDRWSRRKAIAIMAVIWSGFTYLTGLGRNFLGVLLPRMMVGVGESGFSAGGTAMLTAVYPPESRGKLMGIFNLVIPIGAALGLVLGGYLSKNFGGWRTPFLVFAIPGVILGILAFFMRDYKTVVHVDAAGKKAGFLKSALSLFRIPTLKWLYLGYGIRNIMNFSVLTWISAYFMRSQNIPEDKAGMLGGVIFIMAILGSVLGGVLSDTWQKKNRRARMLLPVIGDILAAIILIIALYLEARGAGFIILCLWGAMVMVGVPPLTAVTQDVVEPAVKGLSYGMAVFCMYLFGGGWGPIVTGVISDALGGGADGLKYALIIIALSGFVAAFIEWLGSRSYPADLDKVKGLVLEQEK
ncbi:MAG: MFS transporter [Spirochaetes bacterium]|nr:MAG: MFS transporter [Spirochaetota bacterium]